MNSRVTTKSKARNEIEEEEPFVPMTGYNYEKYFGEANLFL
jgi:hypothetical protein